jgi:hypothetical protein
MERPMTVSELLFIPTGERGTCSCCGRENRPLGRCNAGFDEPEVRCIDCFFCPVPFEYWNKCAACGLVQPGQRGTTCDDCGRELQ